MGRPRKKPAGRGGCHLVGIAGASCSGKSTLASRVAAALEPLAVSVIAMDDYYRDLSALTPEQKERHNFDEPEAIDRELLERHLQRLTDGFEIAKPVYLFKTHCRAGRTERVLPTRVVILEGLFALYWPSIRRLLGTRIFITVDDATCFSRRIKRDVSERGRTAESVRQQYISITRPMYEDHVAPTGAYADIVVNGAGSLEESIAPILQRIWETFENGLAHSEPAVWATDAPTVDRTLESGGEKE